MVDGQAGKGSRYRHVDPKKFGPNYERIFGMKKTPYRKVLFIDVYWDSGSNYKFDRCITRKFSRQSGSPYKYITHCPFCNKQLEVYKCSLNSTGKRCPICGSMFYGNKCYRRKK